MIKWDIHNYDDTAHFLYNVRSYIVSLFFERAKEQNMQNLSLNDIRANHPDLARSFDDISTFDRMCEEYLNYRYDDDQNYYVEKDE